MTSTLDSLPPPTTGPITESPTAPTPEPAAPAPRRRRSGWHIAAIVAGALGLFPGLGLLAGGSALAVGQAVATDDDGYFRLTPDRMRSDGVAVISDDGWADDADDGAPWVLDWVDLDVRVRAHSATGDAVFVGIARSDAVEDYLEGAGYSVVEEIDGREVRYRQVSGVGSVADPDQLDIWVASATGDDEQELTWDARGGQWTVVVMNADGSTDVAADVELGARSDALTPIAVTLVVLGGLIVLTSVALIVVGVRGRRS